MKHGLSNEHIEIIRGFLANEPAVDEAVLFGSRAAGTHKTASDIDLAIKGGSFDLLMANALKSKLEEETNIPFFFDIIAYQNIQSQELLEHINEQGIVIYRKDMGEWKEYKFSEILVDESISYGIVQPGFHTEIDSVPIIRVNNIRNGNINTAEVLKVASFIESKYKRTRLEGGELLITVVGSIGECAIVPNKLKGWNVARAVSVARIKKEYDKRFIKYAFKTDDLVFQMYGNTNDTVQPTLNLTELKELKLLIPPSDEQKAIASVLSSLDDKIDLLHRQNKTLEAMAETLFRQWFIEEADDDWEEKGLLDVIELIGGGTPKTSISDYWDGDIPWLAGGDIASNHKSFITYSIKTITNEGLQNSSTKLLPKFSTVITARGTVGKYCLLSVPMAFSQSNYGILPSPSISNCFFFIYLLVNHIVEELQSSAYGSVFDTITTRTFKDIALSLPIESYIINFEEQINPLFHKLLKNKNQIRTLEKLRDTLLPKLMSGEVRVM